MQTLQPPSKQSTRSNQIQFPSAKETLPRLGKGTDSIQSERAYPLAGNYEVSLMPELHNSSTKASALVQQPFKQARQKNLNIASTQSKFSSQAKDQRANTGLNPPGLVAKQLDRNFRSPQQIRNNQGPLYIDHSQESDILADTQSGSGDIEEGRYGRNGQPNQ